MRAKQLLGVIISLLLLSTTFEYAYAVSGHDFYYDANGNLVQGDGYYYEYNDANQLKRVRLDNSSGTVIAEYWYNHLGQRVKKVKVTAEGNVTTYYVGKHFEMKLYPNGSTVNTTYVYANGERIAKKDSNGNVYYYHKDHLGSSSVITDESGNLVERTRYYPYGLIREGGEANKYYYTGKEHDKETGLYYYGARYYNPVFASFTQPDIFIQDFYDPQSLNRYAYARNNPLKYTDPSGHFWGLISSAISTAISWGSRAASGAISKITSSATVQSAVSRVTSSSAYQAVSSTISTTSTIISNPSARSSFINSLGRGGISGGRSYYGASASSQRAASVISKGGNTQQQIATGRQYVTDVATLAAKTARNPAGASKANLGTFKHTQARDIIRSLESQNPYFKPELSFGGGRSISYGRAGSARLDVIQRNANGDIVAVWDFKFGEAGLTAKRIAEIRRSLPPQYKNVPIHEIMPPKYDIP